MVGSKFYIFLQKDPRMQGMILISSACKPKTVVSMALRSPRTSPGLFVHPTSGISSLQSATEVILVCVCKSNGQLLSSECCTLCHLSYRCYRYCFPLCSALLATIVSAKYKLQFFRLSIANWACKNWHAARVRLPFTIFCLPFVLKLPSLCSLECKHSVRVFDWLWRIVRVSHVRHCLVVCLFVHLLRVATVSGYLSDSI